MGDTPQSGPAPGPDRPGPAAAPFGHDLHWLSAIFLLAVVLRFGAAAQTRVVCRDGVSWYLGPAREAVATGRLAPLLAGDNHPLYPAAVALVGWVLSDWELAAKSLNVILGALLVLPCYAATRTIFTGKTGLFAALIVALMPRFAEYSGDALSEPLAHLLMMSAVASGAAWAQDHRSRDAAWCGFFAGLAYLTRPEGMCMGLGVVAWAGLILARAVVDKARGRPGLGAAWRRARTVAPAALICGALALPYVVYIRNQCGQWGLTKAHRVGPMVMGIQEEPQGGSGADAAAPALAQHERREFRWRFWTLLRRFTEATLPFMPLMFVGFWQLLSRPYAVRPSRYVSAHFWGFFVLYALFNYSLSYALPRRHYMNLGALAMPWIGLGGQAVVEFVGRRGQNHRVRRAFRGLGFVLIVAACAASVYLAWRPHRADKVGLRHAGEWVFRAHGGEGARVMAPGDSRPAFYARGTPVAVTWERHGLWDKPREFADFCAELRDRKPEYLVIETDLVERRVPDFFSGARQEGWVPLKRLAKSGLGDSPAEVWVYRLGSLWLGADEEARHGTQ